MDEFCSGCGAAFRDGDRFCAKCGKPRALGEATPEATPDAAEPEKKGFPFVVLGALVPLVIGLAIVLGVRGCDHVDGQVAVADGPRPGFVFAPTGCASLQPYGRFGANLHGKGENDGGVYVTVDPVKGSSVDVEIPGSCKNEGGTSCTVFSVPRERCTVFEATVQNTGTVVNDVRLVEGHLKLDCALEDGTTVRGEVHFGGC